MSQMPAADPNKRRLRLMGVGLTVVTALTFAVVAGLTFVANMGQDLMGAVVQGALWGAGAGVASVIIYMVYKTVVVKA